MILNRKQIRQLEECALCEKLDCKTTIGCKNAITQESVIEINYISTLITMQDEIDRLKAFKPGCYTKENTGDWCIYHTDYDDDEPLEECKNCHWCEQGYEALGEVEAER